ncbi:MAG: hypothetical protein NWF04_09760 [Candidatus Bathyarchaeota archaeon]|nr:hypothetical protein [Candidatus Bathyarchaeota archaeon]
MTKKENKEITVKAPSKPVVSPKKKAEKTTQKALEEERYGILQVPKRIGKYMGACAAAVGAVLMALLFYTSIFQANWLFLSAETPLWSLGIWFVIGGISILTGFLLIGSE